MSLSAMRAKCPTQHQAQFDAEFAKMDTATQGGILDLLAKLEALLSQLGAQINWGCVFSVLPQAIAALSNPALLPAVLAAYLACAHPPTP